MGSKFLSTKILVLVFYCVAFARLRHLNLNHSVGLGGLATVGYAD
jgi:hypothetical protein